jgi:hypothetical protein
MPGHDRLAPLRAARGAAAGIALLLLGTAARCDAGGFVGETSCANPTCHGAAPASAADAFHPGAHCAPRPTGAWAPWKSARTQWLNHHVDRHSLAYTTLTTEDSKRIAAYMGIDATTSDKCLACHAPPAPLAAGSHHRPQDGVSCEHCHGPAEQWLQTHKATDWRKRQAEFAALGFYDNRDFRRRAEKCASCHVEIDHEIVAGGHPPLQFEMVAYAQIMKHWDDCDQHPNTFTPDPTLWALGQIVGLRHVATAIARRAGGDNYQSLGTFAHFKDQNCYQCHHKLVEDTTRQGQGHLQMADLVMRTLFPDAAEPLSTRWRELAAAVQSNAGAAQQKATDLAAWLAPYEDRLVEKGVDPAAARRILQQLTTVGAGSLRGFSASRSKTSNALVVQGVDLPWWYTTGAREQIALGVQALCPPVFEDKKCAAIFPDLSKLVEAVNRNEQDPAAFAAALKAINAKLF